LIAAQHEGDRLTDDELLAMIVLLLGAGHLTTVNLIGAGAYTLLEHPEQRRTLQSDWSLAESAVDELLRYISPVQVTKPVMPARDLAWHGQTLKHGEKIFALLAAANVDPRKFEDPDRFDVRRRPQPASGLRGRHPRVPGREAGQDRGRDRAGATADPLPEAGAGRPLP
jgi:cytochrome P450